MIRCCWRLHRVERKWHALCRTTVVGSAEQSRRSLSDLSTQSAFDRAVKRRQRNNAARAMQQWRQGQTHNESSTSIDYDDSSNTSIVEYDYIRDEIARRLVDRLDDMKRSFPLALDLGSGSGYLYRAICADDALEAYSDEPTGGIGGVRKLVELDAAEEQLHRDADQAVDGSHRCVTYRLAVDDEEDSLPFPDGTFDLVISSCALHWINQLPNVFSEIHRVLKPDGCFLLAMMGGTDTLPELRAAMVLAELEREGGVSPHVGPFVQPSDVGSLLQRAGFALPTIDVDTHKLSFPNAAVLMEHLQRMGESNASLQRRERVSLNTFLSTACVYDQLFPSEASQGDIEASIQIIYAIGWTPHESQPTPLERGTATHKVGDLAAVEVLQNTSQKNSGASEER
jgi:NADH dehydrogenase [ubiquinone] 1 alpha subcomplex assembly factor 5